MYLEKNLTILLSKKAIFKTSSIYCIIIVQ